MRKSLMRTVFRRFPPTTENRLLRPFLVVSGIVVGAGWFEMRVVIPQWAKASNAKEVAEALERSGHMASGKQFWALLGPAALPLTAVNLYAALGSGSPRRGPWLLSAGTAAVMSVATAAYFAPELHKLSDAHHLEDSQVRERKASHPSRSSRRKWAWDSRASWVIGRRRMHQALMA